MEKSKDTLINKTKAFAINCYIIICCFRTLPVVLPCIEFIGSSDLHCISECIENKMCVSEVSNGFF